MAHRPDSNQDTDGRVVLQGIGVSPGVVVGPVYLWNPVDLSVVERDVVADEVRLEIRRLEEALIETRRQIKEIQGNLEKRTGLQDASILDAHLMVLDDRALIEEIVAEIRGRKRCAEWVVKNVSDRYADVLSSVEDDYLRERVADVRDVARRIIRALQGKQSVSLADLVRRHIIVAADLEPSVTASLRKESALGFATDLGSSTSHTAVMARALEIPAVVGLHDVSRRVSTGDELLIDGNRGVLIIRPSAADLEQYGEVAAMRRNIANGLTGLRDKPAETTDKHRIALSANVEGLGEIDAVLQYGAKGIGLFRSEFLYLSRDDVVEEDEQYEVYREAAERLAPDPVIIRTLDLGGDKFFASDYHVQEANPFLGCRSIRLSLLYPDHFRGQLRAILRASSAGNVRIMYPMIACASEVVRANELLEQAKGELASRGVPFCADIEVGAMIEIPSAALTADAIAEHVSFFSIGTNDLIQYALAVDRANERVAYLYQPTHPAVLKLIKATIDAGHANGIWVGLCGEMAGDPVMAPLLVGMGVDELSVAPAAVPMVKDAIRSISFEQAAGLAEVALSCRSAQDVLGHCRKLIGEVSPEILQLI